MREPRRLQRVAAACLVVLAAAAGACAAGQVRLSGRVLDAKARRPVAAIPVGAVRAEQLDRQKPGSHVKPERTALTDPDGRYEITIPGDTAGLDSVLVFTCAQDRPNLIHAGVVFPSPSPQVKHLERHGVVPIDLREGATGIDFVLPVPPFIMRDVMVPMRDGVRLATDIFLPAEDQPPRPAVVSRTPYNKLHGGELPLEQLEQGCAVVRQDFRGRFKSEGRSDLPFFTDGWGELQDGYDTIEWVAAQPWCTGRVATAGASAGGITQVMTAGAAPPHLTCQVIVVACGSLYHHAAYPGGAFRKADIETWLGRNRFSPECLEAMLAHRAYDDFWRSVDASTVSGRIDAPGLFIGGWYDIFCQGTIDAFAWRQADGASGARGRQKLVMGPWVHGRSQKIGEFTLPARAVQVPGEDRHAAWTGHWLKGSGGRPPDLPAVRYYVMGAFDEPDAPGHEWRQSDVWPVPCEPTPFYLHADGTLSTDAPAGKPAGRGYAYDPKHPVPSLGGCNLTFASGPYDQRPVEDRPDVLLYTSEPLREPLEITGRIKAQLWASSSCRDTDFTAKLTDVYPDGRSVLIQDGIIRARYRDSFEREELMAPHRVYRFEIDLWSTSVIINRGHRIRVAVSSSNAPRFEPNPNTGEPFGAGELTVIARNTIHHGPRQPSHILLPVVKGKLSG